MQNVKAVNASSRNMDSRMARRSIREAADADAVLQQLPKERAGVLRSAIRSRALVASELLNQRGLEVAIKSAVARYFTVFTSSPTEQWQVHTR